MGIRLTFLGGAGTVTGSKYLVQAGRTRILVDCGLFQGFKQLRLRNWQPLPIDPASIDAVVLTHAHLDHSGYLPLLVRKGFSGPVYCTPATLDLCRILLPDSGFLQEKDAEFAARHGFSKHHPPQPLYTQADAEAALKSFVAIPFGEERRLPGTLRFRFDPAGHILGASVVTMRDRERSVVFSGDLGRPQDPLMVPPTTIERTDYLVVESTYGDRKHDPRDPEDLIAEAVNTAAARGGTIVVPSFAVGRAQALLFHLHRLKAARRIPDLPVFLDSPMAIDASDIFCRYSHEHRLTAEETRRTCHVARYVHDVEESKALDVNHMPKIIISASGMATGGRVLHHLKYFLQDPRNMILFAGFQAGGTRGASLTAGAESVKIHGQYIPVRAEVRNIQALSAHADADEILAWLKGFKAPPAVTFVTHGEPAASDALRRRIEEELGWTCEVPEHFEEVDLG